MSDRKAPPPRRRDARGEPVRDLVESFDALALAGKKPRDDSGAAPVGYPYIDPNPRPRDDTQAAPGALPAPLALETLSIFSGKDEQFAYKRALSRVLEMTSRSYGGEAQWAPLAPSARKWEQPSGLPAVDATPEMTKAVERRPELASRTAYRRTMPMQDRPEAPRFGEQHWGVHKDDH
ncbi:hypothetical protein EWM64_g2317 [Hericium alpestre]|uniref:Uncharacterized protein n=1 Tax=Hericium alpestre TaxID=135208 RepID=A0A4Z0A5T3_9AGAM|nr:hypothetical protein EWM64_g2317 [Hericium alpestre]